MRFCLENAGIVLFGTLVPLLGFLSDFFVGREAMFGTVAGLYFVPPLCNLVMRLVGLNAANASPTAKGAQS